MKKFSLNCLPAFTLFFTSLITTLVTANAQCSRQDEPYFSYNLSGSVVGNINNGVRDVSESITLTLCNGSKYNESGHVHSSPSNLYDLAVTLSGGTLRINGFVPASAVITAATFSGFSGAETVSLDNPNVGGSFVQKITPFTDLNNNGVLDAGDCAGEPIIEIFTVTPCNAVPSVNITSPESGTNFITPGPVPLSADASVLGGSIKSVSFFYNDSTLIFTESKAPYSRKWNNVPTGSYYITAVATSNAGVKTTSAPVHITVVHKRPPAVNIISPAEGSIYNVASGIVLTATAVAHGAKITTVKFYSGATLIHTENKYPYSWTWEKVPAGNYTITATAIDSYNQQATSAPVHFTVTNNCSPASQPTFSYNFNGSTVGNVNNGIRDSSELGSVTVCNGGQYVESGHIHSSPSNLYDLAVTSTGGTLMINGFVPASAVITGATFSSFEGTETLTLADPNVGGSFVQRITPFTDLNNNGILDAGDCAGDPVIETFTVNTCVAQCSPASQPTFGYNFNGTPVFNINNGIADSSESATISICNGGQYFTSGHFSSSFSNLYNITFQNIGGTVFIDGGAPTNAVITADQLAGTAGTHIIALADPNTGGTLVQTVTPFTDRNNDGVLNDGDCAGDPIVFYHTATICNVTCSPASQPTFSYNLNGKTVGNINNGLVDSSEAGEVSVCNGGQYTEGDHFNSSSSNLYDVHDTLIGGTLLVNGYVFASAVFTAGQFAGTGGTETLSLADPNTGGTVFQKITPFTDANSNGILDAGDCAGDPVYEAFTVNTCSNKAPAVSIVPLQGIKRGPDQEPGLRLSPNPVRDILNITTTGLKQDRRTIISVLSASGVLIKTTQVKSLSQIIQLNVSKFTSGMYMIKIVTGNKVIIKQFVKM